MGTASLSGKDWWRANQAKYPNSREIDDLEPGFRAKVEAFVASLRHAGATITVSSTLRNATRAHLMHYSWRIAYERLDPKDVPKRSDLVIEWDHGDLEKSRQAALDMVKLFNLAYRPSLSSNHIRGKAIDMNISWKGTLELTQPAPLLARIEGRPRTEQNRELHQIGASVFGVRKLISDPPHWSFNGR